MKLKSWNQLMIEAEQLARDTAKLDGFDFDKMSLESRTLYINGSRRELDKYECD